MSNQIRLLFWVGVFFLAALTFFAVAMLILPRLIVYGEVPDTNQLYVDNADALSTRIATGICNLWQSKNNFNNGFESVSEYKVTSGEVNANKIQEKIVAIECDKIISPSDWSYNGDPMSGKKIYKVKISMKDIKSKIIIAVG